MRSITVTFGLLLVAACAGAELETRSGLWLLPRKDAGNTARSDVRGSYKTAPKEIWSYGADPDGYSWVRPLKVGGKTAYFAHVRRGVQLVRPDGGKVWRKPTLGVGSVVGIVDFGGRGKPVALVTLGNYGFALLDVATGRTLWTWSVPNGAYLGG